MNDNHNSNNDKEIDQTAVKAEKIISRLKEALGSNSDGQLATYLGISRQNIGAARKRNDVPTGWIYKVAELTGCSMDWLGFGQGPKKLRGNYAEPRPGERSQLASPQSAYRSRVDPAAQSAEAPEALGKIASFGTAVEMLAKIYNSGDKTLIGAISANLRAFCEVLDRKRS